MTIVTTNDVAGATVVRTVGEVVDPTVRARDIGSSIGSAFTSVGGGGSKGVTPVLHDTRSEALTRSAAEAPRGANAVVAFRFETDDHSGTGVQVCAEGTAAVIQ